MRFGCLKSLYVTEFDGDQREKASKEEKGTEQGGKDHGRKSSSQRDPLQGIGGPMTRARTKAMKEALNCLTRELNQMEPIYLEESSFLMSKKSPAKLVTFSEAHQLDVQGSCAVQNEEFT